jgi:hypothetical protein
MIGRKVRVVVEAVESTPRMDHDAFLAWLRARQNARAHVPLAREEVDAFLRAERESWDE